MTQKCVECGATINRTDKWVDCCPEHEGMGIVEVVLIAIAIAASISVAAQAASIVL